VGGIRGIHFTGNTYLEGPSSGTCVDAIQLATGANSAGNVKFDMVTHGAGCSATTSNLFSVPGAYTLGQLQVDSTHTGNFTNLFHYNPDSTKDIQAVGTNKTYPHFVMDNNNPVNVRTAMSTGGLVTASGGVTVPSGATLTIASGGTLTCAGGSTCPTASGVTSIATTSPITGGTITTTGTIACATCVTSSSPGVGIAHFAGSTQAVTSSAVVDADLSLSTPALGAATATSLIATGIVDGKAPVTLTTGASASLGTTYNSGYTFNQEGTAAAEVTYTLPTAAVGKQYCLANDNGAAGATTGILRVNSSAAGQHIRYKGTIGATGGYIRSGGAAGDAACFVGISTTDWIVYVQSGTWTQDSGG